MQQTYNIAAMLQSSKEMSAHARKLESNAREARSRMRVDVDKMYHRGSSEPWNKVSYTETLDSLEDLRKVLGSVASLAVSRVNEVAIATERAAEGADDLDKSSADKTPSVGDDASSVGGVGTLAYQAYATTKQASAPRISAPAVLTKAQRAVVAVSVAVLRQKVSSGGVATTEVSRQRSTSESGRDGATGGSAIAVAALTGYSTAAITAPTGKEGTGPGNTQSGESVARSGYFVQTTTNRKGDDSAVGGRSTETIPDLARLGYFVASGVIKIMERGVSWFSIAADVLGPDSTPSQKAAYAKRLSAANGGGVPKVGDTIKIPDTTA